MKLGEFIEKFSHNNTIRLHYKTESGHETVAENCDIVSMDWEVNKQQGAFRHYINNEVVKILSIGGYTKNSDAINIEIERMEQQSILDEIVEEKYYSEVIDEIRNDETNNTDLKDVLKLDCYWIENEWKQPPVKIKHGDLVEIKHDGYLQTMLGRYIGKGYGVVELYNYATGIKYVVGKVVSRGLNNNPLLISDEKLFEFIND